MIDIKFLRENPEVVKQNIKNKFQDSKLPLVDDVIELDAQSRKVKGEADSLRAQRNKNSKMIGALMAQGKKEEAEAMKAQVAADAKRRAELEDRSGGIARADGAVVHGISFVGDQLIPCRLVDLIALEEVATSCCKLFLNHIINIFKNDNRLL